MTGGLQAIGLQLWVARRFHGEQASHNARANIRHFIRQRWLDYDRRGRGNKAWRRFNQQRKRDAASCVWI